MNREKEWLELLKDLQDKKKEAQEKVWELERTIIATEILMGKELGLEPIDIVKKQIKYLIENDKEGKTNDRYYNEK